MFVSVREKIKLKINTDTVEPLHNGHLGDRRRWPLWEVGVLLYLFYCIFFFFWGIQHIYCAKFFLPVAYNGNPIINKLLDIKIYTIKYKSCFNLIKTK